MKDVTVAADDLNPDSLVDFAGVAQTYDALRANPEYAYDADDIIAMSLIALVKVLERIAENQEKAARD